MIKIQNLFLLTRIIWINASTITRRTCKNTACRRTTSRYLCRWLPDSLSGGFRGPTSWIIGELPQSNGIASHQCSRHRIHQLASHQNVSAYRVCQIDWFQRKNTDVRHLESVFLEMPSAVVEAITAHYVSGANAPATVDQVSLTDNVMVSCKKRVEKKILKKSWILSFYSSFHLPARARVEYSAKLNSKNWVGQLTQPPTMIRWSGIIEKLSISHKHNLSQRSKLIDLHSRKFKTNLNEIAWSRHILILKSITHDKSIDQR